MYEFITPKKTYFFDHRDLMLLALLAIWEIIWKGLALWRAGKHQQKAWFVVMLILNTGGVLDILYLLFFQAKGKKETKHTD